jgi:hypothetical protein
MAGSSRAVATQPELRRCRRAATGGADVPPGAAGSLAAPAHRWAPPGRCPPEDRNKHFLWGIWAGVRNERAPLFPQNGQFNGVMV